MEANAISLISQWVTLLRLSPALPLTENKAGRGEFPCWGAQGRDSESRTDERWGWQGRQGLSFNFFKKAQKNGTG